MKRFYKFLIPVFLFFLLITIPISIDAAEAKNIVLQKNQTINKDYFATGENVTLSGTVNGDAYIAGGNVIIDGIVNGDLLVAGGNVNIRGKVTNDIRAAGGQITISGDVGKNITTLGGSITISDSAKITGSLTAAGGNLLVFAPIGKEANLAAGQITLGNTINGDVQTGVGQLTLTPDAKISGNLTYWSDTNAQIPDNSQISGKTYHHFPPQAKKEDTKKAQALIAGFIPAFSFMSFLSALLVGGLLIVMAPVFARQTAQTLLTKPFQSLGVGFISAVLFPIAFIILLITVIGIPLDLMLLAGFLISIYFAKIVVGLALGQKLLEYFHKKASLFWTFSLGLGIYYLLTFIPLLGFFFWMIAGFMGLGAIFIDKKYFFTQMKQKKVI